MGDFDSVRRELQRAGRAVLDVKVTPKSPRTEITGRLADGAWKIKVAAAPERGKANKELCDYLARELGVAKSAVRIASGATSQRKRVVVEAG